MDASRRATSNCSAAARARRAYTEFAGGAGVDATRYGDWKYGGRCTDERELSKAATRRRGSLREVAGGFHTLLSMMRTAGLEATLSKGGPFTLFAPTDEAFENLPETRRAALYADPKALVMLLHSHVIPGQLAASDLDAPSMLTNLAGGTLLVEAADGLSANGTRAVSTDLLARNGIIHFVDDILTSRLAISFYD